MRAHHYPVVLICVQSGLIYKKDGCPQPGDISWPHVSMQSSECSATTTVANDGTTERNSVHIPKTSPILSVQDVELTPLRAVDGAAVTSTLVAAFSTDPVMNYLLRQGSGADAAAQAFFGFNLQRGYIVRPSRLALSSVLRARGAASGEVLGVALWAPPGPPGSSGLPLTEMIRMTSIAVTAFGFLGIGRALQIGLRVDAAHPRAPHYFLGFLAVAPNHQGQGYGARLLAPILARADAEGAACYLENSNPRNKPFYERLGFVVQREIQLPGSGAPKVWAMWRDPK